jgi:hypothetical protein
LKQDEAKMSEMLGPKLLKINTHIGKSSSILDEDAREGKDTKTKSKRQ